MRSLTLLPLGVLVATALIPATRTQAAIIQYSTTLRPEATGATGTGTALVTFNSVANTLRLQTTFSGLSGTTTVAHIHAPTASPGTGNAGVATPVPTFPGFPTGITAGNFDTTLNTLDPASYNPAFITANGGTVTGARNTLIGALGSGRAYLNIHTTAFPGGEIRGYFTTVPEPSALLGLMTIGLLGAGWKFRR